MGKAPSGSTFYKIGGQWYEATPQGTFFNATVFDIRDRSRTKLGEIKREKIDGQIVFLNGENRFGLLRDVVENFVAEKAGAK